MADSVKCPNCGGNLIFDIEKQKSVCDYCFSEFDAEKLKNFLEDSEKKEESGEKVLSWKEKKTFEKKREALFSDGMKFTCNSCGAELVTDMHTAIMYCGFCGSPALISERLSEEFAPDFVIPFKIDKAEAEKLFLKWCEGGKWTPCDYVSDKTKAKITGIYVPFLLYDTDGKIDISGRGVNNTAVGDNDFIIGRKIDISWEKVPAMGSPHFNSDLMAAIEPFDLDELSEFHPAYLQGFQAECTDPSGKEVKDLIGKRIQSYIDEEITKSLKGRFDRVSIGFNGSSWTYRKIHYALFPVWYLHYEYEREGKKESYDFAVNGQTGRVSGKYPVSRFKKLMVILSVFFLSAVLMRVILFFFLGGWF